MKKETDDVIVISNLVDRATPQAVTNNFWFRLGGGGSEDQGKESFLMIATMISISLS